MLLSSIECDWMVVLLLLLLLSAPRSIVRDALNCRLLHFSATCPSYTLAAVGSARI